MKSAPDNTQSFTTRFRDYHDCYVIIGGTATLLHIEDRLNDLPRKTDDLDVVVLDISDDGKASRFLEAFRDYVETNAYVTEALESGKGQAYRFTKPKGGAGAPAIIEIFTRRKEGIPLRQPAQRLA